MMLSTSKSYRGKSKQRRHINWLDLPSDIMANILKRVGVLDILENAQKVCTTWCKICKDPAMWRVIYISGSMYKYSELYNMCKNAVDLSQGQLVDITIVEFADDEVLLYIANKSSQLTCLEIAFGEIYKAWPKALKKFPLLEELSLWSTEITKKGIKTAGRFCPQLKTLKLNEEVCSFSDDDESDDESYEKTITFNFDINDEIAIAIGENLHELRHLELVGNNLSNVGLEAILNGCHYLESIDLRGCIYLRPKGDLLKRCSKQIKYVKWPRDSLKGYRELCEFGTTTREVEESDHGYYDYDDEFADSSSDGSYHD